MRSVLLIALFLMICVSTAVAEENRIFSEPKRVDLRSRLTGLRINTMENGYWEYNFESALTVSFSGSMMAQGSGDWRPTSKGGLKASGDATGGACPDDNCPSSWPWKMKWCNLKMTDENDLVTFYNCEHRRPCRGDRHVLFCDEKGVCERGYQRFVKVIQGAKRTDLLDRTLEALRTSKKNLAIVRGAPAKNRRQTSEVWWVPDRCDFSDERVKKSAQQLANELEPVLGKVRPQQWTFGVSDYDLIVVVGPGEEPLRIKLSDGFCPKKKDCKNPMFEAAKKNIAATGHTLVASDLAKNERKQTEVWYRKGKKKEAERFVAQHLSQWTKKKPQIKEWTWGGDFDLLLVLVP